MRIDPSKQFIDWESEARHNVLTIKDVACLEPLRGPGGMENMHTAVDLINQPSQPDPAAVRRAQFSRQLADGLARGEDLNREVGRLDDFVAIGLISGVWVSILDEK